MSCLEEGNIIYCGGNIRDTYHELSERAEELNLQAALVYLVSPMPLKQASWKPDEGTLMMLASTWASLTAENGVACCDCSCGNIAMMEWAMQYLNPDLLSRVREKLYAATRSSAFAPASDGGSTPGVPSNPGTVTPGTSENHDGRSAQSTGSSRGLTPRGTETESSDTSPGETGTGSAYEVTEKGGTVQAKTGLPLAAILGVFVLVALVGVGYFIGGKGEDMNSPVFFELSVSRISFSCLHFCLPVALSESF